MARWLLFRLGLGHEDPYGYRHVVSYTWLGAIADRVSGMDSRLRSVEKGRGWDMVLSYKVLTDTGTIKAKAGLLYGAILSATGAANVTLSDDTDTIAVLRLAGAGCTCLHLGGPVAFGTSLKLTKGAGTVSVSVFYV